MSCQGPGKRGRSSEQGGLCPPGLRQPIVLPSLLTLSCLPRKASCSLIISVSASPRPEEALNTALCSSKSMCSQGWGQLVFRDHSL